VGSPCRSFQRWAAVLDGRGRLGGCEEHCREAVSFRFAVALCLGVVLVVTGGFWVCGLVRGLFLKIDRPIVVS
jgi:hypothetical protein